MLPKRVYKISGISFLIIGVVLLLNSIVSITGNVIIEDVQIAIGSFWALWFIAVGLLLLVSANESGLPQRNNAGIEIHVTRPFLREIKRHDLDRINNAIEKIGTGLGEEHKLTGQLRGYSSISAGKGERVVYILDKQGKTVELARYLPNHDYRKLLR